MDNVTCGGQVSCCLAGHCEVVSCDVGHREVVHSRVEAWTAGRDVRVEVDVGECQGAVDGGGGHEEGEEADEEDAREKKQGGDEHC